MPKPPVNNEPFVLSPGNRGPVVVVFVICLLCFSVVASGVRSYLTFHGRLKLQLDDALFFLSLLFAVATTILWKFATTHGLGRHIEEVSPEDLTIYFKLIYAAQITGLAASTIFSKASFAALVRRVLARPNPTWSLTSLFVSIVAWGVFALFALSFQCHLPEPWNFAPSNCPSRRGLLYTVMITNILLDAVLSAFIIPDMFRLKMSNKQRWIVIVLFSSRALVCVASIAYVIVLKDAIDDPDQTWSAIYVTILESVVVNVSIITATIPRIHSYIMGMQANLLGFEISDHERSQKSSFRDVFNISRVLGTQTDRTENVVAPRPATPEPDYNTYCASSDSSGKRGDNIALSQPNSNQMR